MVYDVRFTKEAEKDISKLAPKLKKKLKKIIQDTLIINPYIGKKLTGDLLVSSLFVYLIKIALFTQLMMNKN
jgi:hypothetical protein